MSGASIAIDGSASDWAFADRLGYPTNWVPGYDVYGRIEGGTLFLAIVAPIEIGAGTTIWLNTDQNAATGYQVFGNSAGAEFNINFDSLGVPFLYSGGAGEILVSGASVQFARSADGKTVELSVSLGSLNDTAQPAMDVLLDVNNSVFVPGNYYDTPYTVAPSGSNGANLKVAIVYSETTAYKFFGGDAATQTPSTAYTQLFASAQNQAAMAGVPFDILTEADLTDISKLSQYDSIIFPSFSHVDSAKVGAITTALTSAVYDYGVGLITAGNFMTNDQTGAALPNDSYVRLKQLMGLQPVYADSTLQQIDLKAAATNSPIMDGLTSGDLIRSYTNTYGPIGTQTFAPLSGVAYEVLATQTQTDLDGGAVTTTNAIYTTVTGGRNVHFATEGMLADNNLLSRALDWVVSNPVAPELRLEMSRHTAIFASRNDMDQSQNVAVVDPPDQEPGIYDVMMDILERWKVQYNFVGSYYLNLGNDFSTEGDTDLRDETGVNWDVSLPYYQRLLELGNELGSHSYSHPFFTDRLSDVELRREFELSRDVLRAKIPGADIAGAAVPGNPQSAVTSLKILEYYDYLTGGNAMIGSGYPGAFGYISPDTSKGIYFAPNISSDFTQTGWKSLTFEQAALAWLEEWQDAISLADLPVVVFPWHDYGLTGWKTDYSDPRGGVYGNEQMFLPLIEAAYNYGAEFVTLADLAARLAAFEQATLDYTFNAGTNAISGTVGGALGTFQLDLDAQIASVSLGGSAWYAYDADSVFLPAAASTSFTIALGEAAADVTRIVQLPARGQLLAVTGNGTNLNFTLNGEGRVVVDLKSFSATDTTVKVTGATVVSLTDGMLELLLPTIGLHNVGVELVANAGTLPSISDVSTSLTQTLITGTSTAGATVTVREGEVVLGTAIAESNGTWFLSLAPLSNVVHTLDVTATSPTGVARDGATARVGTTANDALDGSVNADLLLGADGNDTLDGGLGADTMQGGTGDDLYKVDHADDMLVELAGSGTDAVHASVTYVLPDNVEHLLLVGSGSIAGSGNALANLITGNAGNNSLSGATGNDTLVGSGGTDTLDGGDGDDTLNGGTGSDSLAGGLGNDWYVIDGTADVVLDSDGADTVQASITYTLGSALENLLLTGGATTGTGNAGANSIWGNATLANRLSGLGGNDVLIGGTAADTLLGGDGNDTLDGGTGSDSLVGGLGNDWYAVERTTDIVIDSGGADTVQASITYTLGSALENLLLVGSATTGTGNGAANSIWGNATLANRLSGLGGNDVLIGGTAADTLLGGANADSLIGAGGNDSLDGEGGNDTIVSGDGRDTLIGGSGSDILTGGAEADVFRFNNSAHGTDRITDFLSGTDKFAFSALGFGGLLAAGMNVEAAGRFITNTTGTASAQGVGQFVYETDIGRLWWDPDGSGLLGRVAIADLVGAPTLRASDIVIIA